MPVTSRHKEDKEEQSYQFSGIVTSTTKYVRYPDGEDELYDEVGDPYELNNRTNDLNWAAEKARLAERLHTHLSSGNARPPRESTAPKPPG